tara:strand:- start:809 stop:1333 length:525 start_codon:yes stop_codon:yes gene_type:complete
MAKKRIPKKKKTVVKEIKRDIEVKEIKEESDLEEKSEEFETTISEERLLEFLQANEKSPVLEQVAIAQDPIDLEQGVANAQTQNIEEKPFDYVETSKGRYLTEINNDQRGENQYVESQGDYSTMFEETKETGESRRLLGPGDSSQGRNGSERVRETFIERDREAKKYISKGDIK